MSNTQPESLFCLMFEKDRAEREKPFLDWLRKLPTKKELESLLPTK